MIEAVKVALGQWNQRTSERQKLQHGYLAALLVIIFIAGLVSLINSTRSREIMYVALAIIIAYVVNVVAWALLQTFVVSRLPRPSRAASPTNRRTSIGPGRTTRRR